MHSEVEPDLGGRIAHVPGESRVLQVDDGRPGATGSSQQHCQLGPRLLVHGQIDPQRCKHAVGFDEITLHVHHDERSVSRIDQLPELGEDGLAFDFDHRILDARMGRP